MCWFWKHKWVEKERYKGIEENLFGGKTDIIMIIQECEKCGKLKREMFP